MYQTRNNNKKTVDRHWKVWTVSSNEQQLQRVTIWDKTSGNTQEKVKFYITR